MFIIIIVVRIIVIVIVMFFIIDWLGKGDFLAVFNRDVSSDETLRAAFQKQYVKSNVNMRMNNDKIADLKDDHWSLISAYMWLDFHAM